MKVFSEAMLLPKYLRLGYILGNKKKGERQNTATSFITEICVLVSFFSQNFQKIQFSFYRNV